jgi:hypothetical protein
MRLVAVGQPNDCKVRCSGQMMKLVDRCRHASQSMHHVQCIDDSKVLQCIIRFNRASCHDFALVAVDKCSRAISGIKISFETASSAGTEQLFIDNFHNTYISLR